MKILVACEESQAVTNEILEENKHTVEDLKQMQMWSLERKFK